MKRIKTTITNEESKSIILTRGLVLEFIDYARNLGDDTTAKWVWEQLKRYDRSSPKLTQKEG
jgi:hypothetical protein